MTQLLYTLACHDVLTTDREILQREGRASPALFFLISVLEEFETLSPKSYSRWKEQQQPQHQLWLFHSLWQGWQVME